MKSNISVRKVTVYAYYWKKTGVLFNECSRIFLFTICCNASVPKAMFEVKVTGAGSAPCSAVPS